MSHTCCAIGLKRLNQAKPATKKLDEFGRTLASHDFNRVPRISKFFFPLQKWKCNFTYLFFNFTYLLTLSAPS